MAIQYALVGQFQKAFYAANVTQGLRILNSYVQNSLCTCTFCRCEKNKKVDKNQKKNRKPEARNMKDFGNLKGI